MSAVADGSCGHERVPEAVAQVAQVMQAGQGRNRSRPSKQFLRRSKRLSRKYSFGILAVLLLGLVLMDAVSSYAKATPEIVGAVYGQEVAAEDSLLTSSGRSRRLVEPPDKFNMDQRRSGAVILHCIGLFYMFIAIALVCDECFVPALEVITEVLDLSPDVAGATFMAAGGSAPEFFTSLIGALLYESDIGTGTIIGSAVFNVLFVIGACALVAPEPLHLTWFPLARDSTFYAVDLIVVTATFLDERIKWFEAVALLTLYICYATFMKFSERIEAWATGKEPEPVVEEGEQEKKEASPDEAWAKPEPARGSQASRVSSDDKDSAGTGEGADGELTRNSASSAKDGSKDHHDGRKHFRHQSVRVANHISLLMSGTEDGNSPGRSSLHSRMSGQSGNSGQDGSHGSSPPPVQQASGSGGSPPPVQQEVPSDSTGGSPDPIPPCASPPKMLPDGFDDVIPSNPSNKSPGSEMSDPEAEEANEPLSIMHPGRDGSPKDWFWYMVTVPILFCLVFTIPDVRREGNRKLYAVTFFMAIVWIAIFTWVMVWFATVIAETCGLSDSVMGLTILAAGTSVPDLLTSMIVARQGHGDMAISSSIGSNIFDVTVGLPVPWLVYSIYRGKDVIIKNESLEITVMLLLGMLAFTIFTILWHNWIMTKWMGSSLMFLYLLFEVVAVGLTFAPKGSLKIIHV